MYTKFQSDIKWRVGRNWTTQLVSQGGGLHYQISELVQ